jgi:hypothetical protein
VGILSPCHYERNHGGKAFFTILNCLLTITNVAPWLGNADHGCQDEDIALATFVLDHTHVARMTFNDCGFEREIFQLFDRQAGLLMERMRGSEPAAIPTLAHSLKGAAADINAGRVSACRCCRNGTGRERRAGRCSGAKDQLAQAVDEVRMEIAALQSVG